MSDSHLERDSYRGRRTLKRTILGAAGIVFGGIVLLSRSGLTIWRARKWISHERP